jgi:hypothetical protein
MIVTAMFNDADAFVRESIDGITSLKGKTSAASAAAASSATFESPPDDTFGT